MSLIDAHPIAIGLSLLGLAYLNSRISSPRARATDTRRPHPRCAGADGGRRR